MLGVLRLLVPASRRSVPDRLWQKVGVDISFKQDYLLVIDYYSKYPEISRLPDKTASTIIPISKKKICETRYTGTYIFRQHAVKQPESPRICR